MIKFYETRDALILILIIQLGRSIALVTRALLVWSIQIINSQTKARWKKRVALCNQYGVSVYLSTGRCKDSCCYTDY